MLLATLRRNHFLLLYHLLHLLRRIRISSYKRWPGDLPRSAVEMVISRFDILVITLPPSTAATSAAAAESVITADLTVPLNTLATLATLSEAARRELGIILDAIEKVNIQGVDRAGTQLNETPRCSQDAMMLW